MLVGVGKLLRIYDMGKKKLLRKCENKVSAPRRAPSLCVRTERDGPVPLCEDGPHLAVGGGNELKGHGSA